MSTAILAMGEGFVPGFANQNEALRLVFIQWPITLAPALFTWLLPALLRYRRGSMAWLGAAVAVVFTVVLPAKLASHAVYVAYESLHPWLYGVFYLYALAGLALCAVGIYDRKRSAWWALFAVLSLVSGALIDTLIWFGVLSGSPAVPWGFIGFAALIAIGWFRRSDTAEPFDLVASAKILANNRTRRARSITRKLLREGQLHFLPLYYVAMMSDMAREGVINSGSYRFADHIYRMEPSGLGILGKWIDKKFLHLRATRAFHLRYKRSQDAIRGALEAQPPGSRPLRVLAIPCGIPRDLTELAASLSRENPQLLARIEYWGMDIDPELLKLADQFTASCGVARRVFHNGNALVAQQFAPGPFEVIVSTGLGEFLKTPELEVFYKNAFDALAPGGTFYTSATRYEKRSEAFLGAFELITQYRTTRQLEKLLGKLPWSRLTLTQDDTGLQTFVVGRK